MISKTDIIQLIDLTSLNTEDHDKNIHHLVQIANKGFNDFKVASVCVYPKFAELIKQTVSFPIRTCVVSSYFPSSQAPLQLKLKEIEYLNTIGIDEIDIVLPIGDFLAGAYTKVNEELLAIRHATDKTIKLIIETGILKNQALIATATEMGIWAGMNFIKTSTGKVAQGADIESVKTMATTIKNSGTKTGIKIAGGIRNFNQAEAYVNVCADILGDDYQKPHLLRIGASSLYNQLTESK